MKSEFIMNIGETVKATSLSWPNTLILMIKLMNSNHADPFISVNRVLSSGKNESDDYLHLQDDHLEIETSVGVSIE